MMHRDRAERELQAAVTEAAMLGGWVVHAFAFEPGMNPAGAYEFSAPARLDLMLMHSLTGRVIFCAMKTQNGQPSAATAEMMAILGLRHDARIVRPGDLDDLGMELMRERTEARKQRQASR